MVHIIFGSIIIMAILGRITKVDVTKLVFFLIFTFAALRYMYGNDYDSYYHWHTHIKNGGESPFGTEVLYALLNQITPSFFILVAITSAIFIYCVYKLVVDNVDKKYIWISIFIFLVNPYIFLINISAIRQCMAMVFFVIAIHFAIKRKPYKYAGMIFIGALFHKSVLFLLPVYFIANTNKVRGIKILIVLSGLIFVLLFIDINELAIWFAGLFEDKNYMSIAKGDIRNSLQATLLTSMFFIYTLINLPKLEGKQLIFGKLYLIATIFGILAFRMAMLTRYQMYFDVFSIVVIPAIIQRNNSENSMLIMRYKNKYEMLDKCINKYLLPMVLIVIYLLRYYSFFTNPMWESFFEYNTIISVF